MEVLFDAGVYGVLVSFDVAKSGKLLALTGFDERLEFGRDGRIVA